jgi:hypothetical protein
MISGRLAKVNHWEEAKINFADLSTDDRLDILEAVQKSMDEEVKRQFEKTQKAKALMRDTRLTIDSHQAV